MRIATRRAVPERAARPSSAEATGRPTPRRAARRGERQAAAGLWLVATGLVLAALNLRAAISGLGPLLAEVRQGVGMSATVAGLLTSMPALCFGLFGIAAPRLARRHGPVVVVAAGLAAITAGTALRSLASGTAAFLAASALALAGIAVGNILMPVIVKRYFPDRVGAMTGLYSMAMAVGTAAPAALTVPLAGALGGSWRAGLGVWAALGAVAVVPWLAVLARARARRREVRADVSAALSADVPAAASRAVPRGAPESARATAPRLTRSPTAWAVAAFFGLQATAAYAVLGWLPQIYRDAGVPATTAGLLLAATMGVGIPLSLVVPRLATRMRHQGPLVVALAVCGLTGYAGLYLAPATGAWLWAMLLGVANCAFPVALAMIGLRARSAMGVARLSAFAQSTGYLLSLPGPLVVGMLNEASGGWGVPLLFLAVLLVGQVTAGVLAGRDRRIEDGDPPSRL